MGKSKCAFAINSTKLPIFFFTVCLTLPRCCCGCCIVSRVNNHFGYCEPVVCRTFSLFLVSFLLDFLRVSVCVCVAYRRVCRHFERHIYIFIYLHSNAKIIKQCVSFSGTHRPCARTACTPAEASETKNEIREQRVCATDSNTARPVPSDWLVIRSAEF